ncbi:helix-turn-helix transcriptional regulator [Roseovarius pacificus]|nr:helix-turn-helix domain-containing protein [Roseovarius pacificus]
MNDITRELLKDKEVAAMLGVGIATVWRYAKSGQIPAPIRFGNSTRWRVSEISEWIEAQQAA